MTMARPQLSSYGLTTTTTNNNSHGGYSQGRAINNNNYPSLLSSFGLIRITKPINLRAAKAGRALLARPKGPKAKGEGSTSEPSSRSSRPENIYIPDDPAMTAGPARTSIVNDSTSNTSNRTNYFNNNLATNNTSNLASSNNNYSPNFNKLLRRVSTDLQAFDDEEEDSSLNHLEAFDELSMSPSSCGSISSVSLVSELGCSDSSLAKNGVALNNDDNNGGGGNVVSVISDRKNEEFKLLADEFEMLETVEPWKSPTKVSSSFHPPKRNTHCRSEYKRDYRTESRLVNEDERVTPRKSKLKRKHSLSTWREE